VAGRVLAAGASVLADIGYQPEWTTVMGSGFMRHALIAGTLVALVAGPIGYFVVVRRDSFAAHALAHIGFPGATAAVLLGAPVTAGLAVFCTAGGLAIGLLGRRTVDRETATGTILALSTALGILFASMASEGAAAVTDVLFGNLLAVTTSQLWTFSIMAAVVLVVLAVIARPLLFASIAPDVAAAKGVATGALGLVLMVLLALVTTMAVQVVGTLLLFALVVTPAAAALAVTARPAAAAGVSSAVALVSVWGGLVLSAVFNLPPSFPIVAIAFVVWALATAWSRTGARRPTGA